MVTITWSRRGIANHRSCDMKLIQTPIITQYNRKAAGIFTLGRKTAEVCLVVTYSVSVANLLLCFES